MKNIKFLVFFIGLTFFLSSLPLFLHSQTINSITISPANPTEDDTITILANCMFSTAPCDLFTSSFGVNGNIISASALHCVGMLTVMCYETDTFIISPLNYGQYTFIFNLNEGGAPAPCTPGIAPGPTDSISFQVSITTSVSDEKNVTTSYEQFELYPNPTANNINFNITHNFNSDKKYKLNIYSSNGSVVCSHMVREKRGTLCLELDSGIYYAFLEAANIKTKPIKIVVLK